MATTYTSADAIADIRGATYDVLLARFRALATVQDVLGNERAQIEAEMKKREADARARLKLDALTPDARVALKAALDAYSRNS